MTMGWNSFCKRHPKLTLHSASRVAYCRAVAQDPEVFRNYFDLLEETLSQIFNCDESGFPLDHKPGKVISAKSSKSLNLTTSGDNAQITVLACASSLLVVPKVPECRRGVSKQGTKPRITAQVHSEDDTEPGE